MSRTDIDRFVEQNFGLVPALDKPPNGASAAGNGGGPSAPGVPELLRSPRLAAYRQPDGRMTAGPPLPGLTREDVEGQNGAAPTSSGPIAPPRDRRVRRFVRKLRRRLTRRVLLAALLAVVLAVAGTGFMVARNHQTAQDRRARRLAFLRAAARADQERARQRSTTTTAKPTPADTAGPPQDLTFTGAYATRVTKSSSRTRNYCDVPADASHGSFWVYWFDTSGLQYSLSFTWSGYFRSTYPLTVSTSPVRGPNGETGTAILKPPDGSQYYSQVGSFQARADKTGTADVSLARGDGNVIRVQGTFRCR